MTVLTIYSDGSITVGHSILSSIANALSGKKRTGKTITENRTLPKARKEKIIRIRQQLDDDTYDIDERLDAVLESILMDITP